MPKAIHVCFVRTALLFWSLIWHAMASKILLKFDASHHAVIVLRVLEATCLSNRTGASVEVVKARCHNCSSKLLFGPLLLKSLHPRLLRNTCNYAADAFQAVPWTAFWEETCFPQMMLINIWVEVEFRTVHRSISREILRFVKVLCWLDQWDQTAFCAFPQQFRVSRSRVQFLYDVFHVFLGTCNLERCFGHKHVP